MKNKGGRPKIQINQKTFEGLCAIQCTEEEISAVLGICAETIERYCRDTYGTSFREFFKTKKAAGRASLRRTQLRHAENNPAMAIFLGKQYLGQSDKRDDTSSASEALLKAMQEIAEKM
ncbi:MAG TPA: hypothetical protein VLH56_11275 [Dissulfurispiraceae bacterium]|nr:hypothetical protein [Dissulfurispiraceae bacterium]